MQFNSGAAALACAVLSVVATHAVAVDEAAVIVSATRFAEADPRVPANISVITRTDIRNAPGLDLPSILATRAGVDVRTLYGSLGVDASVDLRGFGETATSNTLILLDGMRINPIDLGSVNWSAIPLESIQRIEIIRGSGTVLYGDRASGGVINIITDKSGAARAAVSASAGSFGHGGIDVHGAAGNARGYFNAFAHHAASDGWRSNSQQDQKAVSGRAGLYVGSGEAFVDYAAYKDSSGLPGFLPRAQYQSDPRASNTPSDYQTRDGYRLRPGLKLPLSDAFTLEAEVSAEQDDQHAAYTSFASVSDRKRETLAFTPRVRVRHGLGRFASETVLGYDYYAGEVDAHYSTAPGQSAEQKSQAFYVQNSTALDAAWTVTLGARRQRMAQRVHQDEFPAFFSPALDGSAVRTRSAYELGASYSGPGWRAYAKGGSTFRFANTDELFGFDPILFVPVFAGDLRPQHGVIREIGASLGSGPIQGRAAFYRMNLSDEIGFDGAIGANVNFAPTRRQGLEAEIDWQLTQRTKARLAYARTDAEFRSGTYAGRMIPLVPRDNWTLQLGWDGGAAGHYSAVAHYVGARFFSGDFDNQRDKLPGYGTVDLLATWNLKPLTVTARLLNVFDKRYATFAGYSPFISDYYYYPADARSLYVSARYAFK